MPLYTYTCLSGHNALHLRPFERRDEMPLCCVCGAQMQRDAVEQFAVGGQGSHNQQTEPRKMGPGGILRNCTFGNCEVAIKMDGGHLEAEGTTFTGNRKNVEATNAVVRMRNTKSE